MTVLGNTDSKWFKLKENVQANFVFEKNRFLYTTKENRCLYLKTSAQKISHWWQNKKTMMKWSTYVPHVFQIE